MLLLPECSFRCAVCAGEKKSWQCGLPRFQIPGFTSWSLGPLGPPIGPFRDRAHRESSQAKIADREKLAAAAEARAQA
jgi:hypothetical protein